MPATSRATRPAPARKPPAAPSTPARPVVKKPANRAAKAGVAKSAANTAARKSTPALPTATLTVSSKNYSSWSLRGWLLCRFAGLPVQELLVSSDDPQARRELLLLAPSILVPCLTHEGAKVWNVAAIGYYLDEIRPQAALLPADRLARAHCRAICGEMNSGFANLRAALPMNLKAHFPKHKVWAGALPDIERIVEIWTECLQTYGGPYLFGATRCMADAMFAPVAARFLTYDVPLAAACASYCQSVMAMPEMQEWIAAARLEPAEIEELDMDF